MTPSDRRPRPASEAHRILRALRHEGLEAADAPSDPAVIDAVAATAPLHLWRAARPTELFDRLVAYGERHGAGELARTVVTTFLEEASWGRLEKLAWLLDHQPFVERMSADPEAVWQAGLALETAAMLERQARDLAASARAVLEREGRPRMLDAQLAALDDAVGEARARMARGRSGRSRSSDPSPSYASPHRCVP